MDIEFKQVFEIVFPREFYLRAIASPANSSQFRAILRNSAQLRTIARNSELRATKLRLETLI